MESQFSLFDLLILIGITQGVITSMLLLFSKKNTKSNRFLALALIAFCLLSAKILLHTLHLWDTISGRYFPIGIELALPPLLYFYVKALIKPKFKFGSKDALHFIPFIISQSYSMFVYFKVLGINQMADKDALADSYFFNQIKSIEDYLTLVSLVVYLIVSYSSLQNYRQWLSDTISDNTFPSFTWLKHIFILSILAGLFLLVNLSLDGIFDFGQTHFFHWQAFFIFIASIIYYLGFVGYKQPDFQISEIGKISSRAKTISPSKDKITGTAEALKKALEEDKVFLNPTISSHELANSLGVSQSNLSYVVNNAFQKSFRDLINDYRIEEVKIKMKDNAYQHMSILGIALECGFNSEASFYRIFKKSTGLSPKEYLLQFTNR